MKLSEKQSKNERILDIYSRLVEGKVINKAEEAVKYGVNERSIQRDIDDIRAFLAKPGINTGRTIIYSRQRKGFVLDGYESPLMDNSEILAVAKILLDSRAFSKVKIDSILNKLIAGCVPLENMKIVTELLANERFHYVEVQNKIESTDLIWKIGKEIKNTNLVEITYNTQSETKRQKSYIIQPLAIIFSDFYFYLNGFIVEKNSKGDYIQKYNHPTTFRIDRIKKFKNLKIKFKIPYADRFEEGKFRNRLQFMFSGELIRFQFKYYGKNIEHILDKLPTALIKDEYEEYKIIEAEVYGKGLILWILAEGPYAEIIKPVALREEVKSVLTEMIARYQ